MFGDFVFLCLSPVASGDVIPQLGVKDGPCVASLTVWRTNGNTLKVAGGLLGNFWGARSCRPCSLTWREAI